MSDTEVDMSDTRLTIRIDARVRKNLRNRAKSQKRTESEIVRSLIEREFAKETSRIGKKRTFYDALMESGLVASAPDAPPDLSTNKAYMEGFGEWDSDDYRQKMARRRRKA